uniref:Uncharacterized protein n=1 Tax=Rhizophora mucronata TaxID=61149 RepID=A0A2P2N5P1_RHIMU
MGTSYTRTSFSKGPSLYIIARLLNCDLEFIDLSHRNVLFLKAKVGLHVSLFPRPHRVHDITLDFSILLLHCC